MAAAKVLLFEGIPTGKGGSKLGRTHGKCLRKKRYYSKKQRKYVMRCASFAGTGGLAGLGALPFDLDQVKSTLLTGSVAVVGALATGKLVGYVVPMVKADMGAKWIMLMEVITGLLVGVMVGKYAKKPDIGAAIALGPVVVNGLRILGPILTPAASAASAVSGADPRVSASDPLGVTVPQDKAFPGWAYEDPYLKEVQEQNRAWAYG